MQNKLSFNGQLFISNDIDMNIFYWYIDDM